MINTGLSEINGVWGRPDVVVAVSAAAVARRMNLVEDDWHRLFNLNFFGSVRLAQAVVPCMRPHGGNILFVGSIVAIEATAAPLPYSAAKAALHNYSKNLSRALAADGIRVNCLAPGNVLFPGGSWDRAFEKPQGRGGKLHLR